MSTAGKTDAELGRTIGSGMNNTTNADATCTSGAIQIAADYANNGKSDWHLPSKDELRQLYEQRSIVGSFFSDIYWSSSEYSATKAWYQNFNNGNQANFYKALTFRVRAVRAF
jgi:hypothetical protein